MSAFNAYRPVRIDRNRQTWPHVLRCTAATPNPQVKKLKSPTPPNVKGGNLPPYRLHVAPHLSDYLEQVPSYKSPLLRTRRHNTFVPPGDVILGDIALNTENQPQLLEAFLRAGPSRTIRYADGVRAAIVSCGGICPGINTVIKEITLCLLRYGASKVFGVRHGYRGFYNSHWQELTAENVLGLNKKGGSVLGSSRGGFDLERIVDAIETRRIDQVFVIGGDGTIMGCHKIFEEVVRRRLKTSVVSIPKTIDNDIAIIDRSFGSVTRNSPVSFLAIVVQRRQTDTPCLPISVGRNSGFIASQASLASEEVDCCLIPEEPFTLEGPNGVLAYVEQKLNEKGSCVIVVAEGAGNLKNQGVDVGAYLLKQTKKYFDDRDREVTIKFLDPYVLSPCLTVLSENETLTNDIDSLSHKHRTYQIRAIPTTTHDNILCILLAHAAVHGAYSGYTGFSSGIINNRNVLIPLHMLAGIQKTVDTGKSDWQRLRMSTGQPEWAVSEEEETLDGGGV
ncbi:6-phosphofructokinase [Gracilaria domingensis]|nr:6-phosphofructokinase [Gracilaria domingensis]